MRIQHNIMAMNAYRNYTNNVSAMKKNLEKLSSGYKINRAGDDAAGLAISEKMRAQITGLQTAQKNAKDGISLVQTAEGALTEVHDMLNRMVELATQSANGTYDNTDRTQLQKEVNQLLEEIDRIADSSNFNGINLLDGTLGLNTEAFTVGKSVAASDTVDPKVLEGAATPAAEGAADTHVSGTTSEQKPSFAIDFADIVLKANGTQPTSFDVTIGGVKVTATLAKAGTTASATKTFDAGDLADAFVTAFNKLQDAEGNNTSAGYIKGLVFAASATDGKVTFTYQGVANGGSASATGVSSTAMTDAQAKAFNTLYGGAVKVDGFTTGKLETESGRVNCDILEANEAAAAAETARAGITYTLGSKAIADGNTITIDGKTFTIKMSGTEDAGANDIDLRDLVKASATAGTLMRETVLQLSNKSTDNFTIHTKDPNSGEFHLEQTLTSYASGTGELYNYDKLSKLVEVKDTGSPAKTAGTELTVTDAKIKEGNVISVGTDKFVAGKDFNTAAELKTAIEAKGYTVESTSAKGTDGTVIAGKTVLTVRAKATTDGTTPAAPKILGKGLTLQIGDTSDDFNQLNVAVQDMHAASLGLDSLKIDTEEAAQAAIKTIKDAINTVSDVRGTLGATQNRLDHTINNLSVMTENIQDAESTIRDTDVAEEMMAYTKNNILIQSAQAMLAQANQVPQGVLQLLG